MYNIKLVVLLNRNYEQNIPTLEALYVSPLRGPRAQL